MKMTVLEEESTSVFNPNDGLTRETIDILPSNLTASQVVNPVVMNKLRYLSEPFQKQAYTPLQFIIDGNTVKGAIQKVEDSFVWIESEDKITEVEIAKIEDILWRGQPFDTRS
ncbi:hypothetical protein M3152_04425 [Sporosarcina luteola]|uniref:hypothetical protein n=1 Tax=Bacillales TaxID=1385 RepID=UPI00203CB6B7|nr:MULTISPECIES: hypothetical protein [Bacillales]MCM3636957.1 hypothetical protein [Sporosarcina luteola]